MSTLTKIEPVSGLEISMQRATFLFDLVPAQLRFARYEGILLQCGFRPMRASGKIIGRQFATANQSVANCNEAVLGGNETSSESKCLIRLVMVFGFEPMLATDRLSLAITC